jgi:hypothetical protein
MNVPTIRVLEIPGFSAEKFTRLIEQLGHYGLNPTPAAAGYSVTGPDLAGNLSHDPSRNTLTVELNEVPPLVTPGYLLGRFYDEILSGL